MQGILIGLALKYALPTVLSMLAKYGHDKAAELLGSKTPSEIIQEAKAYSEYPTGKNGKFD